MYSLNQSFDSFLYLIYVDVNSCLLSVFGAVIAAATVYDIITSLSLQQKTHYNAGLHSTMTVDGVDDHNSIINNHRTLIIGQDDDLPLLLDTPDHDSGCQRACGISFSSQ